MNKYSQKTILDEYKYFTPYSIDIFDFSTIEGVKKYLAKFQHLSEKIENLIFDFSSAEFIQDSLAPTFNLSVEQGKEITRIIRDVLLCYVFIIDMNKEIQNRLNVNPDTADQIASLIISKLFISAIDDIKKEQTAAFPNRIKTGQQTSNEPVRPTVNSRGELPGMPVAPSQAPKNTFSNPAANLDMNPERDRESSQRASVSYGMNKNNVLDLRNNSNN